MTAGFAELLPGEVVRWEGRPQRHGLFRSTDTVFVPFTLVWVGARLQRVTGLVRPLVGSRTMVA